MQGNNLLLVILVVSSVAQFVAAWIAFHQMTNVVGKYKVAWGCIALALALMVERRFLPLWRLIYSYDTSNLADAVFGMAISLFMVFGIYRVRWLFVDLKALANTDDLTCLANRRGVMQHVQQEVNRAVRTKHPLAFMMFDIDYFKKVNDMYGHSEGDGVLRAVAEISRHEFRLIDTVGRIGGEEFLVVLPESDQDNATAAAERFRKAIATNGFSVGNTHIHITVSIGIVAYCNINSVITVEDVLEASDKALYAAKENGRNRVVLIDSDSRFVTLSSQLES